MTPWQQWRNRTFLISILKKTLPVIMRVNTPISVAIRENIIFLAFIEHVSELVQGKRDPSSKSERLFALHHCGEMRN